MKGRLTSYVYVYGLVPKVNNVPVIVEILGPIMLLTPCRIGNKIYMLGADEFEVI